MTSLPSGSQDPGHMDLSVFIAQREARSQSTPAHLLIVGGKGASGYTCWVAVAV